MYGTLDRFIEMMQFVTLTLVTRGSHGKSKWVLTHVMYSRSLWFRMSARWAAIVSLFLIKLLGGLVFCRLVLLGCNIGGIGWKGGVYGDCDDRRVGTWYADLGCLTSGLGRVSAVCHETGKAWNESRGKRKRHTRQTDF